MLFTYYDILWPLDWYNALTHLQLGWHWAFMLVAYINILRYQFVGKLLSTLALTHSHSNNPNLLQTGTFLALYSSVQEGILKQNRFSMTTSTLLCGPAFYPTFLIKSEHFWLSKKTCRSNLFLFPHSPALKLWKAPSRAKEDIKPPLSQAK